MKLTLLVLRVEHGLLVKDLLVVHQMLLVNLEVIKLKQRIIFTTSQLQEHSKMEN